MPPRTCPSPTKSAWTAPTTASTSKPAATTGPAKRRLRVMGLRTGGQEPVAEVETCGPKNGLLYEIARARPVRPMTLAKEYALDEATAVRQTCGT